MTKLRLSYFVKAHISLEILTFVSFLVDHNFIHPANSPLVPYVFISIPFFSFVGLLLIIGLVILYSMKTISKILFEKNLWISTIGLLLPLFFLLYLLSKLH